jgi:hypothetical protein
MPDYDIAEKAVYAIINLAFIAIIWWVAIDEFFDWLRRKLPAPASNLNTGVDQ